MKFSRWPCDGLAVDLKVGTLELGLSGSRALAERLATSAVAATYTAINQEEEQREPPQEMEAIA